MYWHNPIKHYSWPSDSDPVVQSFHSDRHLLFYDPKFDHKQVSYQQHLEDLANWANQQIQNVGLEQFVQNTGNHYDIANLVKLNLWIADIRRQGIIKPMLINYAQDRFVPATGESRLRALECLPKIDSVTAFIGASKQNADKFQHLEPVINFDHFATLCGAVPGQTFLFRFTDANAPYGIDWYEYDSDKTTAVTPDSEYCVQVLTQYLQLHTDLKFTVEWFGVAVDWHAYKSW